MSIFLLHLAIVLLGASGVPAWLPRSNRLRERGSGLLMCTGGALGLLGTTGALLAGGPVRYAAAWSLPIGRYAVDIDALACCFLTPIFLITPLAAVYGQRYWSIQDHPDTAVKLRSFYGLLSASMALLVIADDAVLLLIAWEVMALAAYFLVTTEDGDASVQRAGWIYLVATHVATLALMAAFALFARATGSFALEPLPAGPAANVLRHAIFALAVVGFGLKAGLMPLHVWLPGAHASAPSHVSAVMSGVMIKMGIYGLARVTSLMPDPPLVWGGLILLIGVTSGLLGVLFAIAQHDIKRLLAYHSIENIGIILIGLGLALIGRSMNRPDWVLLGMSGALLHVWNHGLFKSLLFLSAGSVVHLMGTREIDRMGGLAAELPRTAVFFLIGAVAICGLPPLNGFVSELLVYVGLFRTIGPGGSPTFMPAAVAVPALAMIGALAVACFVKVFGAVFLGMPRSAGEHRAYPEHPTMTTPMGVLAAVCALIGVVPAAAMPVIQRGALAWDPALASSGSSVAVFVPLAWITIGAFLLTGLTAGLLLLLRKRMQAEAFKSVGTWDCGYAAPTARIQYTSSSFAQILVGLFSSVLRPHAHTPRIDGIFPANARFVSHVEDPVLRGVILPAGRAAERGMLRLRFLQQGRVQLYVLYVLVTVIALLAWVLPVRSLVGRMLNP